MENSDDEPPISKHRTGFQARDLVGDPPAVPSPGNSLAEPGIGKPVQTPYGRISRMDRDAFLSAFRKSGHNCTALARKLRCGPEAIRRKLRTIMPGDLRGPLNAARVKWKHDLRAMSADTLQINLQKFSGSTERLAAWAGCCTDHARKILRSKEIVWEADSMKSLLSEISNERLRKLWREHDHNTGELAKRLGCSLYTVNKELNQRGISHDPGRRKFPWTYEFLFRNHITEKRSVKEIANLAGVHQCAVVRQLYKFKIPVTQVRAQASSAIVTKERLHELYWNQNLTRKQIGELLAVSESTIYVLLLKYGIPRKGYGNPLVIGKKSAVKN